MMRSLRTIFYFFLFTALFLFFGETLTCLFFPQQLEYMRENRYTISENVPNHRGKSVGKEYGASFTFNKKGMRGGDIPYENADKRKRLLFLGDSFLTSVQVGLEDHFVTLLDRELNSEVKNGVEIISYGVGGWDNVQELIYLKNEGYRYKPDIVVIFFYIGNDINGNYGRWFHENLGQYTQREDIDLNYRLKEKTNPVKLFKEFFLQRSHFLNAVYKATSSSKFRDMLRGLNRKIGVIEIPELDKSAESLSASERIEKGWDITFKLMDLLKDYCSLHNMRLVYVIIPPDGQIYPDHLQEEFKAIQRDNWGCDNAQPRAIKALEEKGIDYIDLTPYFKKEAEKNKAILLYMKDDLHWTKAGHRFLADILNNYLLPKIEER